MFGLLYQKSWTQLYGKVKIDLMHNEKLR